MTGTAKTEEEELRKVYALDVVPDVPTNKPMICGDHPDVIYKTQEAKFRGITQELMRLWARQQPGSWAPETSRYRNASPIGSASIALSFCR